MAELDLETLADRVGRKAPRPWLLAVAVLVLGGLNAARAGLRRAALEARAQRAALSAALSESSDALTENRSLRDERAKELARFKGELGGLTRSRSALYEAGLELQEEKRLLEKQLEIMTTYLLVDEQSHKISVMRGEQALETYPFSPEGPTLEGDETRSLPLLTRVVSKERYAHPERGKAEQGPDGRLEWVPPQVGTSVRANALGEFVIFTHGPLILHGPPRKPAEHHAFAHYCLGLSLAVARRLYDQTYIGTKILIKPAPKTAALARGQPLAARGPKK